MLKYPWQLGLANRMRQAGFSVFKFEVCCNYWIAFYVTIKDGIHVHSIKVNDFLQGNRHD